MKPALKKSALKAVIFAIAMSIMLLAAGARAQHSFPQPTVAQRIIAQPTLAPKASTQPAGIDGAAQSAGVRIRELKRAGNTVTLEITLPRPSFDTLQKSLRLRAVHGQIANGDPLAAISIPLRVSKNASVTVISHNDRTLNAAHLDLSSQFSSDVALDGTRKRGVHRSLPASTVHHGVGYAALSFIGRMREADISRLELGILDRTGASAIRAARKIVLTITDPAGLSSLPVNDLSEPFKVSNAAFKARAAVRKGMEIQSVGDVVQSPGIQSDDGNVYRMYIRQSGIYHVTFSDLQNFGIDPSVIDPATLRIINKGQQIAVYVYDLHHDGAFHTDDYIEFYGAAELYQGTTNTDFYFDPDTKNNIYFLVWGSHDSPIPASGVKRMVEETGEIRTAKSSPYPRDSFYVDLRDSSFASVLHYEIDNPKAMDPLDISDIDQSSDLRDHLFTAILWTGGLGPATYTDNIIVPFPDVRQNRPISFRAALQGISHFDRGSTDEKGNPLPNVDSEDDCMISINGQFVLHGVWDSQTLKFLSTDTASQRVSNIASAQLLGVNPLDTNAGIRSVTLTVAQQKQTTISGCRFGFDWLDIGYNRMYDAFHDTVTFRAPQFSTPGLYQFTIGNFDRTDISIYRKGISKISNVAIVTNPNVVSGTQAVFQVDVANASDEFIAVSDMAKLKPYKYLRDDFVGLASPNNSGEYLIITNRDHLSKGNNNVHVPLQDLLSYRESTNRVTGKLIDVANIYDEFNGGCCSAQAIKSFLQYAYNNWQTPPKYVL
ncbi:MAG TPA: C25 family cysteine peptidase, partial [Candidatus Kapabacteria bacterium]